MHYLEELAQNLPSNSVPSSSPKEERSEEGNIMSGISLYKRLLKYHRDCQQRVQNLFVRRSAMTRQYSTIFSVLRPLEEKEWFDIHFRTSMGDSNG
jgi:hypothetical protein